MAPKKSKLSKGASSSRAPLFDASKFVSDAAAQWYKKSIKTKKPIQEKGLHLDAVLDAAVLTQIQNRGWLKFIAVQPPGVILLVREFYANVGDSQDRRVFVRGKYVSIAAEEINAYYGTPNFPVGDEYSVYVKRVGGSRVKLDNLLDTLCIRGAHWIQTSMGKPKEFLVGKLKPHYSKIKAKEGERNKLLVVGC